jgi:hypothetical protein
MIKGRPGAVRARESDMGGDGAPPSSKIVARDNEMIRQSHQFRAVS